MLLTQRRHLNWLIRCCFLAVLLHVSHTAGTAQTTLYKSPFPVTQSAEAFSGQPTRVKVRFQFYFPVDNERYLPVSEELAARLSAWPTVAAEPSVRVRILTTVCEPRLLRVPFGQDMATVTGGEIVSELEITPDYAVTQGVHTVTLDYRTIDLTSAFIRSNSAAPAEVRITVEVWASQAAKQEAARLVQEKRLRQEALEAQVRYESRMRLIKRALPFLAVAVLIGGLVYLNRKWIWPDLIVELAAGGYEQRRRAVPMIQGDERAEPGTILQTVWARNRTGRLQRIKVETFLSEDNAQGAGKKLDLLVSVGKSVRRGTYLAKARNCVAKIIVT